MMGDVRTPERREQILAYPAVPVAEHAAVKEPACRDISLMVAVIEDEEAALSGEVDAALTSGAAAGVTSSS